jgi:hypothetical protein
LLKRWFLYLYENGFLGVLVTDFGCSQRFVSAPKSLLWKALILLLNSVEQQAVYVGNKMGATTCFPST